MTVNPFLKEAKKLFHEMREIRRDIHKHPEIGMKEIRTSRIVADFLEHLGLEVKTNIGKTGVTGTLYNKKGGKTVALRADMDALEMKDKKTIPYASAEPGIAHACGHDGHTAILLGTAKLLCKNSDSLMGNVKFIFQPSEEKYPGGATLMIRDGVLKDPKVDGIFTLHLQPLFREGTIAVKSGQSSIAGASFTLRMIGHGGHISQPQKIVDPIIMAGMVITAVQTIVSRRVDPLDPTIVAFGSIHGGTVPNVIPDEVVLTGCIRTLKPGARKDLAKLLEETAQGVASSLGGKCDLTVEMGNPSVYNHPDMVAEFKDSAAKIVVPKNVIENQRPIMGGDDAAYYHEKIPGVYWLLGTANPEKGFVHPLHSSFFDFNEEVMPLGAATHAQAVTDFLTNRLSNQLVNRKHDEEYAFEL